MRINTCFGGRKLGIMASSARGSTTRLPENQLREREKDGRIRRFIWDVLTLRMLAYVFAQPATFTFIVSFLFITVSMPPMAAYIRNADQLPDLDTMRVGTLHRSTNHTPCNPISVIFSELECVPWSTAKYGTVRGERHRAPQPLHILAS